MTAPSPSWNTVRVYGTWNNLDGTLKSGSAKVRLPARITDKTDDVIIPAGSYTPVPLQTEASDDPSFDEMVPATDDPDNEQTGWTVQITVTFDDGSATENYNIAVPYANRPVEDGGNGLGVNLRTVAVATSLPQTNPLYKVGVAGGLATLNAAGQVVDASGTPVTGGGGEGGGPITADLITDATTTGKNVLRASSQANARAAIGAGTSSLALGTSSSTALAGDATAAAATKLATARQINGVNFDGTADINPRLDQAALPTENLDLNGVQVKNANDPSDDTDLATKGYTDTTVSNAVATKADLETGRLPVAQLTLGGVVTAAYDGSDWDPRPTTDAAVRCLYITGESDPPIPDDFIADWDILLKPVT